MTRILSQRELNRTLLHRQLLLKQHDLSPSQAIEHLAGMQAQIPNPPYIGLWTRLQQFERNNLTQLMDQREVVRAALMRSTLHLMTASDYIKYRKTIEPALIKGLNSFYGKKARSLAIPPLVEGIRPHLTEQALTTGEQRDILKTIDPNGDPEAMAYAVRAYLPQVQVPPGGTWGSGSKASYILAESYLGQPMDAPDLKGLFFRYLAAAGPATIMDFQFWVGISSLTKIIEAWRDELLVYKNEAGKALFDLPNAEILPADSPAPIRFVPEYDNLIISHKDRTRIIADDDYKQVFLSAARVLPTILVDGFVAGTWKIDRNKDNATLMIQCFRDISPATEKTLKEEGEKLVRWVEDTASVYDIQLN